MSPAEEPPGIAPRPGRAGTLVIIVHGSLGNYMGGVPRRMAFELAHRGYAAVSINTRMANFRALRDWPLRVG